jgi:aminoglycoside phosphotransferase (APT) family kinase protein
MEVSRVDRINHIPETANQLPLTSPALDEPLVRRLLASQFPQWAGLPLRQVHGGVDNRTFRLGDEMSVRLPNGDWYAQQVDKEQRWLPLLASQLPLPIPSPVGRGAPEFGYPYTWSIYRWIDGESASQERITDLPQFATSLAQFLVALRKADARGGPAPGQHNWFRGGPLATYADDTFRAIDQLGSQIPRDAVLAAFRTALASSWEHEPVWVHGDVAAGNLLVRDRCLAAVIDFGSAGVGDPACDVVIAWTFLTDPSRPAFRESLGLDSATWSRGRGWALWKALITLAGHVAAGESEAAAEPRRVLEAVLDDHAAEP